jgi:hypothetical protein
MMRLVLLVMTYNVKCVFLGELRTGIYLDWCQPRVHDGVDKFYEDCSYFEFYHCCYRSQQIE